MTGRVEQGLLLNRTGQDLHVWGPPSYWDGPESRLPTVVGPFARVNEWLEEVGVLRDGVRLVGGGTSFSFTQLVQATDADGSALAAGSETALATTITFLGSGTGTGAGGFWYPGKTLGIHFRGALSSAGSTPGNFNLNLRQTSTSGTSAGAQGAYALATSLSSSPVALDAFITCRNDGSAGNIETCVEYSPGATPSSGTNVRQLARANIGSFDTTANQLFVISGLFSAWVSGDSATAKLFFVEVLN